MKHKLNIIGVTLPLLLAANVAHAETEFFGGKVTAGGYVAQHWQSPIEVSGNRLRAADADQNSGFQRLRVGLWFNAQITDGISAFMELADEPNDFGEDSFGINQDLAWIDFAFGSSVNLRVGNVVETTMNFIRYSDGAAVQGNPLIGNGVNDMITATHGLWLLGGNDTSFGKWDWNLTLTSPSFADNFSDKSGYNYGARTSVTTNSGFGFGAGVFIFDGDVAGCPTDTSCTLSNGGTFRSLLPVGDGDHYVIGQQPQNTRNGVAGVLPGIDGHVWQLDAMWSGDSLGMPVTIHGFYGQGKDDYSFTAGSFAASTGQFSETDAEQSFWGILARVDFNDKFYLATRYGVSYNDTSGVGGDDKVDRLQIGVGYWVGDSTLIKAEYVRQNEDAQSGGGSCNPAATGDCDWDGFVIEASVSF